LIEDQAVFRPQSDGTFDGTASLLTVEDLFHFRQEVVR
jgi:hypothetical protein